MCVAVITRDASFSWFSVDKRDIDGRLKSGNNSFSAAFIIHSLFSVCSLFGSLPWCNVSQSLFPSNRNFGSNVLSCSLSIHVQFGSFLHLLCCCLLTSIFLVWWTIYVLIKNTQNSRWMIPAGATSLWTLNRRLSSRSWRIFHSHSMAENKKSENMKNEVQEFNCF